MAAQAIAVVGGLLCRRLTGAPDRTRTCYRRLRRPVLYPNELRALCASKSRDSKPTRRLVGVERFELPTSCSQSKRATGLRYTPRDAIMPLATRYTQTARVIIARSPPL